MTNSDLACPVVTETTAAAVPLTYQNKIEGGLTKRQEVASRIIQGLTQFAMTNSGKVVEPKILVNLGFAYADLILSYDAPKAEEATDAKE